MSLKAAYQFKKYYNKKEENLNEEIEVRKTVITVFENWAAAETVTGIKGEKTKIKIKGRDNAYVGS